MCKRASEEAAVHASSYSSLSFFCSSLSLSVGALSLRRARLIYLPACLGHYIVSNQSRVIIPQPPWTFFRSARNRGALMAGLSAAPIKTAISNHAVGGRRFVCLVVDVRTQLAYSPRRTTDCICLYTYVLCWRREMRLAQREF